MAPRSLPYNGIRSGPSASSDGLAPWVVPSAPLPQGDSPWLAPSTIRYAAGSKEEKRAWGPPHGGTIAQSFLFCNEAVSGWKGGSSFAQRFLLSMGLGSLAYGLAEAALPPAPPSNVFGNRGTRCTPDEGCAPCTLLGRMAAASGDGRSSSLAQRAGLASLRRRM